MPILGIGVDIVQSARFLKILGRYPHRCKRFQDRILHPLEINAESKDIKAIARQLTSSWAAKEALYKSLDSKEQKSCKFNQWRRKWGAQGYEMISNEVRQDQILVSLSHDGEYTVAFAIRQPKIGNS